MAIDDIEQIKVSRNDGGAKAMWSRASAKSHGRTLSTEWYVAKLAEDVTNQYITGPPGQDAGRTSPLGNGEAGPPVDSRSVFVVHGRDIANRDALFSFLHTLGLDPIEWIEAVRATGKAAPYIGEILDAAFSKAHAVIVLLTPDDEARLQARFHAPGDPLHETELSGQARPNVLFEAGMAMSRDQDRTVLIEIGALRPFSDIAGRHTLRFDGSTQRRQELAQRLSAAGCPVKLDGLNWHTAGDFEIPPLS